MQSDESPVGTGLRIVVDASMARGGGGLTYLLNLVPTLVALAPQHRFLLIVNSKAFVEALEGPPNLEILLARRLGYLNTIRSMLWAGSSMAERWAADLYFSVAEYAPLSAPCPVIVAFRNLTVFAPVEGGWPLRQRVRLAILRTLAVATARRCKRVIFVSHDSSELIGDQLGIPESKRCVIHHGIDVENWTARTYKPTDLDRYLLAVGSIYRYKNYTTLIRAWFELRQRRPETPDLVIIGDDQDPQYFDEMKRIRSECGELAENVHLLGGVPYRDIAGWYRFADAFVFPSCLETFGHPLLEAMVSRVPLVASDIPVFREIAGDAALYADPDDASAFAARIEETLDSEEDRSRRIELGVRRLDDFSWSLTAKRLLALFEETV